jgi:GTPase SAR1 family protein
MMLSMCQVVAKMFARSPSRTRFHNVRAIGLYGVGGIGKTTLCKSLCNDYLAKFNGKVWHAELGKKSAEDIQKDVLYHLVGISTTLLNENMDYKGQVNQLLHLNVTIGRL